MICFCQFANETSLFTTRSLAAPSSIVELLKLREGEERDSILTLEQRETVCSISEVWRQETAVARLFIFTLLLWSFCLLYGRKQSYSLLTSIQFMEMERKQKHKFDTVCHCGVTTYWPVCGVLLILIHYLHMYFRFSHNSFIILVLLSSVNSECNLFMQLVVFFVFKEFWVLTVSMLFSSITRSCEKALFRCFNLGPVSQTYPDWSGLYSALSLMLNVKTLFTKTKEG